MKVRRMRCPKCGSLETVKNGKRKQVDYSLQRKTTKQIQRYKCNNCQSRFVKKKSKQRYSRQFKIEITRMHLEERMSFRVISKRLKEKYGIRVSKTTLCKMVNQIASYSKGDIQIKEEYRPNWEGYLTIDDKYFSVKGKKRFILTATDSTGDFIHSEIFEYQEQSAIDEFCRFIKERLGYPVLGITTDLDEMLKKSIETVFGKGLPHQQCIKHALDTVARILNLAKKKREHKKAIANSTKEYLEKEKQYQQVEKIYKLTRELFYSTNQDESKKILRSIITKARNYPELRKFIMRHYKNLLMHQKYPKIKRTNNIAENINRQLMRRLKTIESFQRIKYAENYLNLYKNYLRFKTYTDCRGINKTKNGKSPLEICGVKLQNRDWLKNALIFS